MQLTTDIGDRQALLDDLNARINPERSRSFDVAAFAAARERLEKAARTIAPNPVGLRVAVVGSNGKGSTAYYLGRLFAGAPGLLEQCRRAWSVPDKLQIAAAAQTTDPRDVAGNIGLYTSPHLVDVCERIRIDGQMLTAGELIGAIRQLHRFERVRPFSYFEILSLVAWFIYQKHSLPAQIFEAGLGGRLDATRVARPQVVVLTQIVAEHVALLGTTPQQIVREKLGIATRDTRCVIVGPQPLLAPDEITEAAADVCPDAEVLLCKSMSGGGQQPYLAHSLDLARKAYTAIVDRLLDFVPNRRGVGLMPGLDFGTFREEPSISLHPGPAGRLEFRPAPNGGALIYDTAHNVPAVKTTLGSLSLMSEFSGAADCLCLFGVLRDRQPELFEAQLVRFGFRKVVQLSGEELAPGPHALALEEVPALIAAGWSEGVRQVLLIGTHRLYGLYLQLAGVPNSGSFLPAGTAGFGLSSA